jgi:hypothetical protein
MMSVAPVGCSIWSAPNVGLGTGVGVGEAVGAVVGPWVGGWLGGAVAPGDGDDTGAVVHAAKKATSARLWMVCGRRARAGSRLNVGMVALTLAYARRFPTATLGAQKRVRVR